MSQTLAVIDWRLITPNVRLALVTDVASLFSPVGPGIGSFDTALRADCACGCNECGNDG